MNAMFQGTSDQTRLGNVIYPQYLEARGAIKNNDTAGGIPHTVRIIAFIAMAPNNVEVLVDDLIDIE